ncbi:hypothetical protein ACFYUD_31795 [Nocardia tengchongensis]|uniref:hypothetical protein n=1 Tax=Nocardia tengchongensis TaxID=2055889 RepID=UPI0036C32468
MTKTRTLTALAVLPVLAAAGQGITAAAPGQPGLAVPGDGQPGLSTAPSAPSPPSVADYIPDPPAPPARPRPRQQTNPSTDALIRQPPITEPDTEQLEPAPEPVPVDPHTVRAGNTTVVVPDWIDTKTRDKAQAYLDYAEWQIAAGYDALGFPRQESDRRAASTITGGALGAVAGAELVSVPAAGLGCGVGAVVGGLVGAAIGTLAAGVGMPFGAGLGAGLGCLAGTVVGGAPGIAVGTTAGAVLGGAAAGALGGGVDAPKPDLPPLIEVPPIPEPSMPPAEIRFDQPHTDVVAAVGSQADAVIASLRTAIAAFPPMPSIPFGID